MKKLIAVLIGATILMGGLTIGYTADPSTGNGTSVTQPDKGKGKCSTKKGKKKHHKKGGSVVTPGSK
jgi:hypothetical protein